jgi:hypothetical protein
MYDVSIVVAVAVGLRRRIACIQSFDVQFVSMTSQITVVQTRVRACAH